MTTDELQIVLRPRGPLKVVIPIGDLDLSGATRLLAILAQAARTGSRVVVVDLSRLTVPDDAGHLLMVFPAAQRRAGCWPHSAVHLAAPGRRVALRLRRMGMARFLPVHATVAAAMIAAEPEVAGTRREFAVMPDTSGPGAARELLGQLWPDTRWERDARQDGMVVVSELTSNAARHAGTLYTVSMALSARHFLVGVTDPSRSQPILQPVETLAVSGRGMQLVSALSHDWGARLIHERGKTVWASLGRGNRDVPAPGTEVEPFAQGRQ
jgi:anti-anti-sigma regulatory factor